MNKDIISFVIQSNGNLFYGAMPSGLKSIYKTLECSAIEGVRLKDSIMYIDEEGKFKDPPVLNKVATIIAWMNGLSTNDWIAGNAMIVGTVSPEGEMDGEDYDCPQHMFELFQKFTQIDYTKIDGFMSFLRKASSF